MLAACVDRPLTKVDAVVLDTLRLGAHQLLGMRVPAHAAISTSVDLARARGKSSAAGFVNAVLRKVAGRDLEDVDGRRSTPTSPRGTATPPGWSRSCDVPSATPSSKRCSLPTTRRPR